MANYALIMGAGDGVRMGRKEKPFLLLSGKPILAHTVKLFEECDFIDKIIIVARKDNLKDADAIVKKEGFSKVKAVVVGGEHRQLSVYNGLKSIKEADYVFIQDAVRPLVTKGVIKATYDAAKEHGAAIPCVPARETVKKGKDVVVETLDRNIIWGVQTPQVFRFSLIKKAYEKAMKENLFGTDDAFLVENLGKKVAIVQGNPENIKITVPTDLILAEALFRTRQKNRIEVKAFAKINREFNIVGKRNDGYHEISSIFQAVDAYDHIVIHRRKNGFSVTGSITTEIEKDFVTKAKNALEHYVGRGLPCRIHIIKGLPISAGIGGGSSDGAAVLVGLNELYSLGLGKDQLKEVAAKVSCDSVFFVSGHGSAHVSGTGEIVRLHEKPPFKYYLLARPHKRLPTQELYDLYDKHGKSFQELAVELCPDVKKLIDFFSNHSKEVGMSGSGPVVFVGFESYEEAESTIKDYGFGNFNGDWFICRPVPNTYEIVHN